MTPAICKVLRHFDALLTLADVSNQQHEIRPGGIDAPDAIYLRLVY